MRVAHDWDEAQLAWRPRVDGWGQTSHPGLRIAGDSASITGALAAEAGGSLAALGAAEAIGRIRAAERDEQARPLQRALAAQLRIRPFLDALYRPPLWLQLPADDTIVCRCEEVTAGRIREMAKAPADVGAYRIRPPLKPVPIASIASLAGDAAAQPDEEEAA